MQKNIDQNKNPIFSFQKIPLGAEGHDARVLLSAAAGCHFLLPFLSVRSEYTYIFHNGYKAQLRVENFLFGLLPFEARAVASREK